MVKCVLLLQKAQVQCPAPTRWLPTAWNSNSREPDAFSGLHGYHAHVHTERHMHRQK